MSKADQLVKRAISFEALSILSDRKTFLQSIAQGFDPETIKQFENLDEFGNPKQEGIPDPPPSPTRNPIDFKRTSPAPTREPISFQRTSPDGGFDPDLISKYENLDEFGNPKQEGIPAPEPVAYTMPTTNIVGKPPSGAIARK